MCCIFSWLAPYKYFIDDSKMHRFISRNWRMPAKVQRLYRRQHPLRPSRQLRRMLRVGRRPQGWRMELFTIQNVNQMAVPAVEPEASMELLIRLQMQRQQVASPVKRGRNVAVDGCPVTTRLWTLRTNHPDLPRSLWNTTFDERRWQLLTEERQVGISRCLKPRRQPLKGVLLSW